MNGRVVQKRTEKELSLFKLRLPRKPKWEKSWTKQELLSNENKSFLAWRRKLTEIEENNLDLIVTPYEKNIEVWR